MLELANYYQGVTSLLAELELSTRIFEPCRMSDNHALKKESGSEESSVIKIPLRLKLNKKQPDLEVLVLNAEQIEAQELVKAQQLMLDISAKEAEATTIVHIVEQDILEQKVDRMVEGNDDDANEFAKEMILCQENLSTEIDQKSDTESPEAMNVGNVVDYVAINKEEDEQTSNVELP
ncbi:hypothetical protein Tco_1503298 [Tanacetum coccineum]